MRENSQVLTIRSFTLTVDRQMQRGDRGKYHHLPSREATRSKSERSNLFGR